MPLKRKKLDSEKLKTILNKYRGEIISEDSTNVIIKFMKYEPLPRRCATDENL